MPKFQVVRVMEQWIDVEAEDEDAALQAAYETPTDEWELDGVDYVVNPESVQREQTRWG